MKKILFIALSLFVSFSCKKTKKLNTTPTDVVKSDFTVEENLVFNLDSYFDTIPSILEGNYEYIYDTKCIDQVNFNPNNPSEIVYKKYSPSFDGEVEINIYNRDTKTSQYLATTRYGRAPVWGRNDWILFGHNAIYAVKSNGDSIKTLIEAGGVFYPQWNYDATRFYFRSPLNFKTTIYNFYTNKIDTLPVEIYGDCSWDNLNNQIVSNPLMSGDAKNYVLDMNTMQKKEYTLPFNGNTSIWINNDECLLVGQVNKTTNRAKLYICNFKTKKLTQILSFVSTAYPEGLSYNNISNELMIKFRILKQISDTEVLVKSKVLILNMNNYTVSELII